MTAKKLRLVLVITELEVGGAERCLTNLAVGLDRQRFEPTVIALAPPPTAAQQALVQRLKQAEVPVEFLGFASRWRLRSAVSRLRTRLAELQPDVVQSMLFHANVVSGMALRRDRDRCWCAGVRVADPSRFRQAVERRVLVGADRIVCVSQQVARLVSAGMGLPTERIQVIPNGIDVATIEGGSSTALATLGLGDSRRAITCVARLARQKGLDQLLLAAPVFLRALPHHELLIVGDGPEAGRLRREASRTNVARRIHFCGWRPDATGILRSSDLFVLPSRWEGMPNVLLEAMACSLPVVCTQVEGVSEVLGPLEPLQTVPAESPQLFAAQVVKILGDATLASELGRENKRRVAEHFALETMLNQYARLFEHVVRGE